MKQCINIEIINEEAMTLLRGMERLHLIYIMRNAAQEQIDWQEKYEGAMSRQSIEEIEQQLQELRNAWE